MDPERVEFDHLKYAPFVLRDVERNSQFPWGDLRIEGYIKGEKMISKSLSGLGRTEVYVAGG